MVNTNEGRYLNLSVATGYLRSSGIEMCMMLLSFMHPKICTLIILPNQSVEGRTIRSIKIGKRSDGEKRGVLFTGGVHAREIVNPDLLVSFAFKLCYAYETNTGLVFGGKSYDSSAVQLIVNTLDVFILPLVNPDGREFVQSPTGDHMWRKNRSLNFGLPCRGVDINRNSDFLWDSGIGSSTNSCSGIFKGPNAFSEPETRNVQHILDTYPTIACMVDVHSYSELILYPWGDDDSQTTDPTMNFMNPFYDGVRGTSGNNLYKEYIPQADLDDFVSRGNRVRDAIAAVRGRLYTTKQGIGLYPTSGTLEDYPYSRHFVDTGKRKISSITIETGTEFQPEPSEGSQIIAEVSAGLVEFCLTCICVVQETVRDTDLDLKLVEIREFRDKEMRATDIGRKYIQLLEKNTALIMNLIFSDKGLRDEAVTVLREVNNVVQSKNDEKNPKVFEKDLINRMDILFKKFEEKGDDQLRDSIREIRKDLKNFEGKTVLEGLNLVNSKKDMK